MRRLAQASAASALAALLAACGSPSGDETAPGPSTETAAPAEATAVASTASASNAPPAAFMQCRSCHAINPGQHGVGPSLAGVFGTKAGDIAGYMFSDALKGSNLTWDEATLDKWIAGPAKLVPGTKMTFAGIPDAAKRNEIIDYIKTLK